MNNKLIIKLIKNNIEEIRDLILHFQNEEDDLHDGFPLLESRLNSLNKDIEILKSSLNKNKIVPDAILNLAHTENHSITTNQKEQEAVLNMIETVTEDKVHAEIEYQAKEQTIDKVEQTISTLNDKLQGSRSSNLQEKIKNSKLTDIQSAIGINDQFLFIRELFDNNSTEYKSSINYINSRNDYNEIISHFNKSQKWDIEDGTVIQFFDLIKRKFE
jgi:chromosome segregation ATPase